MQLRLAEAQEDAGQLAAAIASLRTAIRLRPDYAEAHAYLGLLLADTRRHRRRHREPAASRRAEARLRARVEQPRLGAAQGRAAHRGGRCDPQGARAPARLRVRPRDAGAPRARPRRRRSRRSFASHGDCGCGPICAGRSSDSPGCCSARAASTSPRSSTCARSSSRPRRTNGFNWEACSRSAANRRRRATRSRARLRRIRRHLRAALGLHLTLPMLYDGVDAHRGRARGVRRRADGARRLGRVVHARSLRRGSARRRGSGAISCSPTRVRTTRRCSSGMRRSSRARSTSPRPICGDRCRGRRVAGRRIRIGFASAFFKVGTVGMYFRRWITGLDRSQFEIFAYHLHPGIDARRQRDRRRASTSSAISSVRAGASRTSPRRSATTRSTSSSTSSSGCIRCRLRSPRCGSRLSNAPRGGIRRRPVIRRSTITCRPRRWSRRTPPRTTASGCPAAGDRHAVCAAGDSRGHRPRALLAAAGQGAAALPAVAVQGASGQRRRCWPPSSRPRAIRRSCSSRAVIRR